MNKAPILLRSLFALALVAVFVWSMFPLKEADFYETFLSLAKDPQDPKLNELIQLAKEKQKDSFKFPYPSTALESAAEEVLVKDKAGGSDVPISLVDCVKPKIVRQLKLQTNSDVISLIRKNAAGAIRLGIDLHGGAEFMLKLNADEKAKEDFDRFRDNAVETLRKRLEAQGFYECDISPAGGDLVSVRVPVVTKDSKASLERLILRSARLEFRLVKEDSDQLVGAILEASRQFSGASPAKISIFDFYKNEYLKTHPELAGYELMREAGDRIRRYFLVSKKVEMEGSEVTDARVQMPQFGSREIALSFSNKGAEQFGKVTSENVGRLLAIVLDGQLYSAPRLQTAILEGQARITGNFSEEEAKSVADALVAGSLPFEITIVSRSDIDPTVGGETIRKSIWSGIIGTILVMLFMIVCYRLAGLVADLSLIVNAFVMVGAIAAFDVTLTLPGIAGIILTLGMAVDANVLIYERIREEIKQGKSVANAINIGFNRAFSAIFDSNLTTLFVALILFWQGSGAIKGFAITLSIGIFTTLFTAVFLTRIFFDFIIRIFGTRLKSLSMLAFLHNPRINFIGIRAIPVTLSIVMVLGSLFLMIHEGRDMLGIDFTGGSQILVQYAPKDPSAKPVPSTQIEKYLKSKGYDAKASYKTTTDVSTEGLKLLEIVVRDRGEKVSDETGNKIIEEMDKAYPQIKFTKQSQSTLGALIGATFTKAAAWALSLAMLGMILYMVIRFQFSYSIAANIALLHDVIVSMGIYLAFGGQLTLQVVASLLTLIGYSVNDTIVTFDRQRENITLLSGKTYFDVVNISVNQTLGRTILTSVSVALILVAQLLLGGEGIRDFIAVMLIGCIVGCYSSIFISPLITAYWHRKERNIREDHTTEFSASKTAETAGPAAE